MSPFPQPPMGDNESNGNFKFGIILIAILLIILIIIFGVYSWRSSKYKNGTPTVAEKTNLIDRLLGRDDTTVTIASIDTDKDGLSDKDEQGKTDPAKVDTDGDTLSDREEQLVYKTDPTKADTDGDGMNDGDEINARRDPLNSDPKAEWPPRPATIK